MDLLENLLNENLISFQTKPKRTKTACVIELSVAVLRYNHPSSKEIVLPNERKTHLDC